MLTVENDYSIFLFSVPPKDALTPINKAAKKSMTERELRSMSDTSRGKLPNRDEESLLTLACIWIGLSKRARVREKPTTGNTFVM